MGIASSVIGQQTAGLLFLFFQESSALLLLGDQDPAMTMQKPIWKTSWFQHQAGSFHGRISADDPSSRMRAFLCQGAG